MTITPNDQEEEKKKINDTITIYTMVKTNMFNGIHHPSIALWTEGGTAEIYKQFSYEDYRDRMS